LTVAAIAGILAVSSAYQFSYDGAGYWLHVAAGGDVRADLAGRNLGQALVILPVVMFTGAVVAAVADGWAYLPPAAGLADAAVGVGLGVGDVVSVRTPVPMPEW